MQNEKEQERIGNMKEEVDQMMPSRFQSKHLAVQHMGKPRQWVPVMGMGLRKGPRYALQSNPILHITVSRHVVIVIK
jgi:hypothetical protein